MKVKSESEVVQSCPTLSNPMDCSLPGSSVYGFSRQEYWSGVPLPSLRDRLPTPYSWASLVAQLVRNPPAMRDAWVQSLGWEDPLGKGKANPFQYSGLENSKGCIVLRVAKSQTQLID